MSIIKPEQLIDESIDSIIDQLNKNGVTNAGEDDRPILGKPYIYRGFGIQVGKLYGMYLGFAHKRDDLRKTKITFESKACRSEHEAGAQVCKYVDSYLKQAKNI